MYLTACYFLLHPPYLSGTKPSSKPSFVCLTSACSTQTLEAFRKVQSTFSSLRNQRRLKAISTSHSPFQWIKFHAPDGCNGTAANAGCLQFMNSLSISTTIHHFGNVYSVITTKACKCYLSLHNILKRQNSQGIAI